MLSCDPCLVIALRAIACVPRGQERSRAWNLHAQPIVRLELRPRERSTEMTPMTDSQKLVSGVPGQLPLEVQSGRFNTMTSGTQGDIVKVAVLNPGLILPGKRHPGF